MTQPPEAAANNSDRIRPDVRLADRYQVEEVVGYGGMSTVYRGRDSLLDRDVAIKVLNQQLNASESDRAAFLREARAAASLSHPGIVGTYDAGVFNGWPYIVMEFVPGGSLKEIIDTRAPLPPDDAVAIAIHLADALEYGHGRGVVHCDVKPQNVLMHGLDQPKLVDFGISQSMAATAALTSTVSGTAGYVAPEQLEGLPLDGRADVYSLGTVLYQLLTRSLPFEAPNLTALATRRLVADPRPIRELNPSLSPALAAIVMRCLARAREARFASAGELAAALRSYQRDEQRTDLASAPLRPPPEEATQLWQRPAAAGIRDATIVARGPRAIFWPLAMVLALVLGVLIVLAVVVLSNRGSGSSTATAQVPQVVNARVDDAATQLHQAGLIVSVDLTPSDQPFGTVVSQEPAAGTQQPTKDPVLLKVSRGR